MDRKKYSIFIILYTIFNIGVLIGARDYINEINGSDYNYEGQEKLKEIDTNKNSKANIYENKIKDYNENKNENLVKNNPENEISLYQIDKSNKEKSYESDEALSSHSDRYYNGSSKNRNSSTQGNKVFKVTAEEIISDLNTIEKAKILWVCRKLTKEEYNEIEEYLSYSNEKVGVMKVYRILENKLDEDSLEEVKEIFSKYIDTEKVKEIFY